MVCLGAICAQGQWADWSNQYPYQDRRVYSHMMHGTSDGNLLLCASIHGGWTPGSGIPFEDYALAIYLLKTDPSGDTLWTVRMDSIKPWSITHVVDLMDGNTLVAGTAQSSYEYCGIAVSGLPMAQLFALKIDQAGNVLWWNQYDQPCSRILADAWESPTQEIHLLALDTQEPNIVIGYVQPNWFEHYTLDSEGNTVSVNTIQQAYHYFTSQHGATAFDGGRYIASSVLDTVGQDHLIVQLEKLNVNGVPQSALFVTDTSYCSPIDLIATLDSGLLMLLAPDVARSRLLHLDTVGNVLWDRIYSTGFREIIALPDSTFLAVGSCGTWQTPNLSELCVTLISASGDPLWVRVYGDSLYDRGSSIARTQTGYVAYGTKDMYSGSVQPRLFLTWDTLGLLLNVPNALPRYDQLKVFPNPASDEVAIRWNERLSSRSELTVYDAQGRLVLQQFLPIGSRRASVNIGTLANGCYLVNMRTSHAEISARLMVVH
jgi:hypothetical protein